MRNQQSKTELKRNYIVPLKCLWNISKDQDLMFNGSVISQAEHYNVVCQGPFFPLCYCFIVHKITKLGIDKLTLGEKYSSIYLKAKRSNQGSKCTFLGYKTHE